MLVGNHAQLRGSHVAERLRSTLAYGWVEHCSDIAGCGEASSQDKYFLVYLISATVFACLMNYEHVECLND